MYSVNNNVKVLLLLMLKLRGFLSRVHQTLKFSHPSFGKKNLKKRRLKKKERKKKSLAVSYDGNLVW